jgi:hypothetical protein
MTEFHTDATINGAYDQVGAFNTAKITMSGGEINELFTFDNSKFDMFAGKIIMGMYIEGHSIVNIYGGELSLFDILFMKNSSVLNLYGGNVHIDYPAVEGVTAAINIYGYGFSQWPATNLTGFLSDSTPFVFTNLYPLGNIHLFTIPEPATVLLLGLGGLVLLARRRSLAEGGLRSKK